MKADKDWLEDALRSGLEERKTGDSAECPSSDDLVRLVTREAGRKERERTLDHVAGCGECAKLLKSLLRISGEFERVAAEAGVRETPRPVLRRRAVLAAVAALAGLTIVTFSVVRLLEKPAVRGAAGVEVRLLSPKPGATLASSDIEFRWEAVAGATAYRVDLFDRSLAKLWRSADLEDARLMLPAEAKALVREGESYFWRVTATLDNGREVPSKLAEFTVR